MTKMKDTDREKPHSQMETHMKDFMKVERDTAMEFIGKIGPTNYDSIKLLCLSLHRVRVNFICLEVISFIIVVVFSLDNLIVKKNV